MRVTVLPWLAPMLALLAGCPVQVPEARFSCAMGQPCPPAMTCDARGLCVRAATDAGLGHDATLDASDSGARDAATDAGDAADAATPQCQPSTLSLLHVSGTGDEDAPGIHVLGAGQYRVAVSFSGVLAGMSATGFDAALIDILPGDVLTFPRLVPGPGDTLARALSTDGTLLSGSTGTATFGGGEVTVPSGAVGFVDLDPSPPLVLGGTDPAATVSVNAVARVGALVCAGGTFRGQLQPGDGATYLSDGDDGFVGCWDARLRAVAIVTGPGNDAVSTLVDDGAGGLFVGGRFSGTLSFGPGEPMHSVLSPEPIEDAFVAHLSTTFEELGFFQFGSDQAGSSIAGIAFDAQNVYAVGRAGTGTRRGLPTAGASSSVDPILVRLDPALVAEWFVVAPMGSYGEFMAVALDACGRPNVAGGGGAPSAAQFALLVPEVRVYSAIGDEIEHHVAASGTGYFRAIARSGPSMVAVGRAHSGVAFAGMQPFAVQGGSDLMILELRR